MYSKALPINQDYFFTFTFKIGAVDAETTYPNFISPALEIKYDRVYEK